MGRAEETPRAPGAAPPDGTPSPKDVESLEAILQAVAAEFRLAAGRPERVEAACSSLHEKLAFPPSPADLMALARLVPLLRDRGGALAAPLFALLEEVAGASGAPWTLLEGMILARDRALALRALQLAAQLVESGSLHVTRRVVRRLAGGMEAEDSPLAEPEALAAAASIVGRFGGADGKGEGPVRALFLEGEGAVRRLAARLLDLSGPPSAGELSRRLLGPEACAVLGPYLDYTRATHLDLLCLVPSGGGPSPLVESLRRAEGVCGEGLLREVIAELGWPRVNLGIEVQSVVGVSVGGSLPFMVLPWEAPLLEAMPSARRVPGAGARFFVFTGHGGRPVGEGGEGEAGESRKVGRFRSYNLLHASLLAEILDIAPLEETKVRRVLAGMDALVGHFIFLFGAEGGEGPLLGSVYGDLRRKVLAELERQESPARLSAELTRLVQAFEDPRSLGEVRTLHGLKRYLHQRGLRLAFRLVEAGRGTNRTVDLVAAAPGRPLSRCRGIRYVDFEPPPEEGGAPRIPYPVAMAAEQFARQLLHGQESFPETRVFCYGNEVHFYLAFDSHPAFLRLDATAPLQGGMIDLEFYGVSKFQLEVHPDPSLDLLCRFLRDLEFDVSAEATRVHARYDKERTLELGELLGKAQALFRLAPYLMDLDWTLGALDLDAGAREKVARAWSGRFLRWGVLPLRGMLTRDRRGILEGTEAGPGGEREVPWSGRGAYRDRFAEAPAWLLPELHASLGRLGAGILPPAPAEEGAGIGQIDLERSLLRPLRAAVARGEMEATPAGPRPRSPQLFRRRDEAARFAEILSGDEETIAASVRLARRVAPLERSLRFSTTGSVGGHPVQRARLSLKERELFLYVLRDAGGIIRLALYSDLGPLCSRREDPSKDWVSSERTDLSRLASLLRGGGYLPAGEETSGAAEDEPPSRVRDLFRRDQGPATPAPLPGENLVGGLGASPGRCVGRALFPGKGRRPEDFAGSVLVAPILRPEDNTFLFHSAGVVSTGGGILSHAGLIAVQFGKPALIIPGTWREEPGGAAVLWVRALEYGEERREVGGFRVSLRRNERERERPLREGDLIALDADEGTLRILGQERDALALQEGFRLLGELDRRLAAPLEAEETLRLRGRRLHAMYQSEKLLGRLEDPVLARHAVRELMLGEALAFGGDRSGRERLLSLLLENSRVGPAAREVLIHILTELERRCRRAGAEARERIPSSSSVYEILSLRHEAGRLRRALADTALSASAADCRAEVCAGSVNQGGEIESLARRRLEAIRDEGVRALRDDAPTRARPDLRHALRQIDRLGAFLAAPAEGVVTSARAWLARRDEETLRRAGGRRIVGPEEGGLELAPLVGWKAANLAEVARLPGGGRVPPWFAVTDRAFQEVLDAPLGRRGSPGETAPSAGRTLREAIGAVLLRPGADDVQKAALIRDLWEKTPIPGDLAAEVERAYAGLGAAVSSVPEPEEEGEDPSRPYVAVRSSTLEEDMETAARAGEFDTFLFVRGETCLLDHLKRAWSGLWTERAIHNREVFSGSGARVGGGVIVQRIVNSRVSGVLQTVNVAEREAREMVINAGLGLGEGIVSGAVAADHVVVLREGDPARDPLRFRYLTADKREKVVFNRREGLGTRRVESLYHQRLRPALEYVELVELVRCALRLEAAYGYPLDLEFGIEGPALWILQVRPVAAYLPLLRETRDRLSPAGAPSPPPSAISPGLLEGRP